MKRTFIAIITLVILSSVSSSYAEEKTQLSQQTPSTSENEYLYEIKDNEIMVNDKLITLFAFSKDGVSASYRNKTDKKKKPKIHIQGLQHLRNINRLEGIRR